MSRLSTILDYVDSGAMLLPEFQRGYVWNRDQVRSLMGSLYRNYPVGSLLVWDTEVDASSARGNVGSGTGTRSLLLDGQQRITSLYGVMRGKAPAFFQGDPAAFTDLCFHVGSEEFRFYMASEMRDDSRWVDVSTLFTDGLDATLDRLEDDLSRKEERRLTQLYNIRDRDLHVEPITGEEMTMDIVVDIFNRVNSGGTKLSKGDLALAKVCSDWPEARDTMRSYLNQWERAGMEFTLDWFLRCVTAVATGKAVFSSLEGISAERFASAMKAAANYIGKFLDTVGGRLGLDHDRVLMGRYAVPVVCRLLHLNGGDFTDARHRDRVLFWYVHAALRGRYAGSTETVLARDYTVVEQSGVDGLINELREWRGGTLQVRASDFEGHTKGSRFYPLLYLLTRVGSARDFHSGLPLHAQMLGRNSRLEVHHIFPKAQLRERYPHRLVNAIANFCFLTQDSNGRIGKRRPSVYFPEVEQRNPGVLESQWIPRDPNLWELETYEHFLAERTRMLAEAANDFLDSLRDGSATGSETQLEPVGTVPADHDAETWDARTIQLDQLVAGLRELGYAEPERDREIAHPRTGAPVAVAEAYWPEGLQTGQGDPVVLELDPQEADLPELERAGIRCFTSADALWEFTSGSAEPVGAELPGEAEPQPEVLAAFHGVLESAYERVTREANHHPARLGAMLEERGALGTARTVLDTPQLSDDFVALAERDRLDLTVESVVLQNQEFTALFSTEQLERARQRLALFR